VADRTTPASASVPVWIADRSGIPPAAGAGPWPLSCCSISPGCRQPAVALAEHGVQVGPPACAPNRAATRRFHSSLVRRWPHGLVYWPGTAVPATRQRGDRPRRRQGPVIWRLLAVVHFHHHILFCKLKRLRVGGRMDAQQPGQLSAPAGPPRLRLQRRGLQHRCDVPLAAQVRLGDAALHHQPAGGPRLLIAFTALVQPPGADGLGCRCRAWSASSNLGPPTGSASLRSGCPSARARRPTSLRVIFDPYAFATWPNTGHRSPPLPLVCVDGHRFMPIAAPRYTVDPPRWRCEPRPDPSPYGPGRVASTDFQ